MISTAEFENLIERPESSILDFKKEMYDFSNDQDQRKTAEFVKDIIAFANTIRTESAFIIIGIKELPDKSKEFHGITSTFDDAILQDKVKDKVYPRPNSHYYTILYNGLRYGIFEFPVTKYSFPISPTVKIKGLEPGKIYYRNGSSNTEALGIEIIKISDWLRSLPDFHHAKNRDEEVNALLKKLTAKQENLSIVIADLYALGKAYKITELLRFCAMELQGIIQV